MPTSEKLRNRLIDKLKELFELDQPDLDFGFYRIMHARAQEVEDFINRKLDEIVKAEFGEKQAHNKAAELEKAREKLVNTLGQDALDTEGSLKPTYADTPIGKEYLQEVAAIEAASEEVSAEADVYDHLYRFFSRYYEQGDFISRRYYRRETAGSAAPYAIPYNGEEVVLHWANADQYYIKTTEHFRTFTFDIAKASEPEAQKELDELHEQGLRVHFRIVEGTEGEHANIKENSNAREFFLHKPQPVEWSDSGELTVNFEYRPATKEDQLTAENKKRLKKTFGTSREGDLKALALAEGIINSLTEGDARSLAYKKAFQTPVPVEKISKRPLLAKYVTKYMQRNTADYFIHKDLGTFLKRELDFYIKNEVVRLDELERMDATAAERYLSKVRVIRNIATPLIEFLAQLEDFQKKLWLKKKFVVETNYGITLDLIPEEFYPEIARNQAQHDRWVELYHIHKVDYAQSPVAYSDPLTPEFLKAHDKMVVDTATLNGDLKARLLSSLDRNSDGVLVQTDNYHGLRLLDERYRCGVDCVYIDPPFNTAASEILYQNSYKHSSWMSLIDGGVAVCSDLLHQGSVFECAIDDAEFHRLAAVLYRRFGRNNHIANIAIMHNPKGREQAFVSDAHEYLLLYAKNKPNVQFNRLRLSEAGVAKKYPKSDQRGRYRELPLRRRGTAPQREDRPYMYFPFFWSTESGEITLVTQEDYERIYDGSAFDDSFLDDLRASMERVGWRMILPIREDGSKGRWRWGIERCRVALDDGLFFVAGPSDPTIYHKDYANDTVLPKSLWYGERYDASTKGTNLLKSIIPRNPFNYPKSVFAVMDAVELGSPSSGVVLDYFAGSGTTGHAVIKLNREVGSTRKYVMMEMGDYFDTVLKPRIEKVVYSPEWKDGKPTTPNGGSSHLFKYIRLESYEDTLNNLEFGADPLQSGSSTVSNALRDEFTMRYMLDVRTRGSRSLLNIDAFKDPTEYKLKIKKPGSDEYEWRNVDLIETFNYLIGLRVNHIDLPRQFAASFKHMEDPDLPEDAETRLVLDGKLKETDDGKWWFRKLEGWIPEDADNPDGGNKLRVLIIWRKLTDDIVQDNAVLDEWLRTQRIEPRSRLEYDLIYVNGTNNLPNVKLDDEHWRVRLIEEEFSRRMWDIED